MLTLFTLFSFSSETTKRISTKNFEKEIASVNGDFKKKKITRSNLAVNKRTSRNTHHNEGQKWSMKEDNLGEI